MRAEVEKAVELLQAKRPDAVERALGLLQQTVFAFSMKVCGHREDAEDTMQDVLLKSLPYLGRFDSPQALGVWLYTVAKNRCLMARRRSKFAPKEHLSLEELMPERQELERLAGRNHQTPETFLLEGENAELVKEAVLKLPPEYRLVLVLHDMEEVPSAEIAKITGLREGTVRVRLHRARLFVRKQLASGAKPRKKGPTKAAAPAQAAAELSARRQNCKQMFATLSDYLDNALDESMCEELEKHMKGCAPCEAFLVSLGKTVHRLRSYDSEGVDPKLAAEVRRDIMDRYRTVMTGAVKNKKVAKPH
jgi:RNA polymerase sigma-70 factor (ECF subfamily)